MRPLSLRAYAKINTFLAVGPRGQDGYHPVRTIMQAIDLQDQVTIYPSESLCLSCSLPELDGEANLAWKALRLFSELFELPKVHVEIRKQIPIRAGLGGGSSDVAAVLQGMNEMLRGACSKTVLSSIAAVCGSDAPFFLLDSPRAKAEGRGDVLTPLKPLPESELVVAMPSVGVATGAAYAMLDALGDRHFREFPKDDSETFNDFERVALPESLDLIARLQCLGAAKAHLCGSGASVYGIFPNAAQAVTAAARFSQEGLWARHGRTLVRKERPQVPPLPLGEGWGEGA